MIGKDRMVFRRPLESENKKRGLTMGIVLTLLLAAVFIVLPVMIYNRLVRARNEYRNALAQIQVQLKRRHDLVPNLVEAAAAALKHERQTLEAVMTARNQAAAVLQSSMGSGETAALAQSENALTSALRGLNVAVEAYPELKGNETIQALTEELSSTENRVAFARQAYNDSVMSYNNTRETFPASLLADFFGHKKNAPLLHFDDYAAIRHAPKVRLDLNG